MEQLSINKHLFKEQDKDLSNHQDKDLPKNKIKIYLKKQNQDLPIKQNIDSLKDKDKDSLKEQNKDILKEQDNIIKLLKTIDWQRFHNLCVYIGKDLNDPQWRFLKSIFLELSISEYSNNILTYVGNSHQGCDFLLNNVKIEMKYVEGCLFYTKTQVLKKYTSSIKLINSNGTNKHSELPTTYSDFLLVVDLNGAGLISKERLKKYITSEGDGIKAKIPTNELHIIFKPTDISQIIDNKNLQIKEIFMEKIHKIIKSV